MPNQPDRRLRKFRPGQALAAADMNTLLNAVLHSLLGGKGINVRSFNDRLIIELSNPDNAKSTFAHLVKTRFGDFEGILAEDSDDGEMNNVQKCLERIDGLAAADIPVDTTNFDNNLSPDDDTVQKCMETLDEVAGGGGGLIQYTKSSFSYNNGAAAYGRYIEFTFSSVLAAHIDKGLTIPFHLVFNNTQASFVRVIQGEVTIQRFEFEGSYYWDVYLSSTLLEFDRNGTIQYLDHSSLPQTANSLVTSLNTSFFSGYNLFVAETSFSSYVTITSKYYVLNPSYYVACRVKWTSNTLRLYFLNYDNFANDEDGSAILLYRA